MFYYKILYVYIRKSKRMFDQYRDFYLERRNKSCDHNHCQRIFIPKGLFVE